MCSKSRKGGKIPAYVIKQAKAWISITNGKKKDCYIDENEVKRICDILSLMVHPDLHCDMSEGLEPYAMWLIIAVFCTKKTDGRLLYTTALLEISRKNFKTFNSAVIFIVALLIEPNMSRMFSVAPDYKLSSELRVAVRKIIKSSPLLQKHFKITRDMVTCFITDSEYTPLAYSNDRLDGKLATIWLADEAGAMGNYPIAAMRSSQITLKNKLGIIISTQYPNDSNGFIEEVDISKKALDKVGGVDLSERFSLLYEPDEDIRNQWEKNNNVIYQSNPAAVTNVEIFKEIKKLRTMAVLYESQRENYLCKHNNIPFKGVGAETYIPVDIVRKCKRDFEKEWWSGKRVYLGVDLSQTDDNTAVAMVTIDENENIYAHVTGFIPQSRIDRKSEIEKVDYRRCIREGCCFACGDEIIDYKFVEDHILSIQKEYDVEIMGAGFDRYNAMSTMQRLENADEPIDCTEVKQHSSVLHPATKLLREKIYNKEFYYDRNILLENNFSNARCTEDTNLNKYVNKKRSSGKVDMVVALINAVYMLMQNEMFGNEFFVDVM